MGQTLTSSVIGFPMLPLRVHCYTHTVFHVFRMVFFVCYLVQILRKFPPKYHVVLLFWHVKFDSHVFGAFAHLLVFSWRLQCIHSIYISVQTSAYRPAQYYA